MKPNAFVDDTFRYLRRVKSCDSFFYYQSIDTVYITVDEHGHLFLDTTIKTSSFVKHSKGLLLELLYSNVAHVLDEGTVEDRQGVNWCLIGRNCKISNNLFDTNNGINTDYFEAVPMAVKSIKS